jgi:hypothetical protein
MIDDEPRPWHRASDLAGIKMPLATRVPKPDPPRLFVPPVCLRDATPDSGGMCHGEGARRVSLPRDHVSLRTDRFRLQRIVGGSAPGLRRV